ncbi:outer membrane protein/peptidoglycan-associated (lipo)protein [Aequorivita sublithincola DSM 14238]|uniref:Outer membrane protein/peptidoglycan-associated (Lipo)protein n=1 Tax=Aequorivita sublithincola (strain DSM 14238 / LMG 21431 / ACAM 643 / 9-3) TaxID=746697 RepID=I3YWW6_AEQSU|nr:OmpA family protein [Aequorivita sublithincola]AFL81484.1 outer membrane protein/peptidoglycan-associated (lipo)protein [Aequorivita sublithincola DSM 14238]
MNTIVRNIFLFAFVVLTAGSSFAQQKDIKKANKEFDKFAYIDAREIYLKVVEDGYESAEIFKKLGDTYYFNSDYTNAAKWYEKLVTQFPDQTEPEYYYRAAQSLKSLGKYSESDALLKDYVAKGGKGLVIKKFEDDPNYLKSTVFKTRDFALEKVGVNTSNSDFGASFYGEDKIVYASASNTEGAKVADWTDQPFLDLFMADRDSIGQLSNATRLRGDINTAYHESSAAFTKDEFTVYFTRNNFLDGKKGKDKNKTIRLKLYKATKGSDSSWSNVVELPFNSKEYSVAHPALSPDGKKLYFSSDMPGTLGMSDLWYVDILPNDTYGTPINLGSGINTEARESFPFISDKNNLYFSSDGRSGLGGYDIFVTPLDKDGKSGIITNLGAPSNSAQDDFGFIINEDSRIGYVSSNRGGDRGSIDDDIYLVKEICSITIKGKVFDEDTKDPIPGASVSLLDENNQLVNQTTAKNDGTYSFIGNCGTQYTVRGVKEGYNPYEKVIETPLLSGTVEVPLPLKRIGPCPPNDLGCKLNLQPIYFDFDKSNIRQDAEIELAKILAAMGEYPELIIHIESHTDSRGNDNYNEALSERRAQSTLKWLVSKGIDRNRLTAKGYGETQLVNQCSNGVPCTAEEHQLNRRSMFIIKN